MKHFILTAFAATLTVAANASPSTVYRGGDVPNRFNTKVFQFAPKAHAQIEAEKNNVSLPFADKDAKMKAVLKIQDPTKLPQSDISDFIDGPDMSTYFYTMNLEKTVIQHEYYPEYLIKKYSFTIYDSNYQSIGSIEDDIVLPENAVKVAAVEISGQLTKTFWNFDNKIEVMVMLAYNMPDNTVLTETKVYTLGNNTPIARVDGYPAAFINATTDSFSEKFYVTFVTEAATETPDINGVLNGGDYVFNTYKNAGYSGMGDPILTTRVPMITASGENYVPFLANQKDGVPYFASVRLKYCYFENPYDMQNETLTPDNELIVDLYKLPTSFSSTAEKYSTTTFPSTPTLEDSFFLYVGGFKYNEDIVPAGYDDFNEPVIVLTKQNYIKATDGYSYDYDVYTAAPKGETAAGTHKFNICKEADNGIFMSDLPGVDPQIMFIKMKDDDSAEFEFVNPLTGKLEHTIPYQINKQYTMTAAIDRVASGSSYLYAVSQTKGYTDTEGDTWNDVVYLTPEGEVDHVDALNLGKDVDNASIYINSQALSPFVFNIDDEREYMVLIKRRNANGSGNHEEMSVISSNPEKEPLMTLAPDDKLGKILNVFLTNLDTNAGLNIIWYDETAGKYTLTSYPLPLNLYENGEGTVDKPYEISTLGGLMMMYQKPEAHYIITNDIDAQGQVFSPKEINFKGTLDGQNHIISNLVVTGRAIFYEITGSATEGPVDEITSGVVKNINFVNPVFKPQEFDQGFVAGTIKGGLIQNIRLYGSTIESESNVAGIVGNGTLYSTIEGCLVDGDIKAGNYTAGLVVNLKTSTKINACSFSGSIEGDTYLGGIVASIDDAASTVTNCHVNASIKGLNTIGGVAAYSSRGRIANCHVEGSLEATEEPQWGGGVRLGGIVGELEPKPTEQQGEETNRAEADNTPAVIENCFVNLTSLKDSSTEKSTEEYAGQNDTMHRIVGKSSINGEPEIIGYDQTTWEPIFGDPASAETNLRNNYAISTIQRVSQTIEDAQNTTEGKSVTAGELNAAFFEGLGFGFGFDNETPWSRSNEKAPELYFEASGLVTITPSNADVEIGKTTTLTVELIGKELTEEMAQGISINCSDESIAEVTGTEMVDGAILITVEGKATGTTRIDVSLNNQTVTAVVNVIEAAGIDNITEAGQTAISFDGTTVTAPDCNIAVYNTVGMLVAKGHDTCNLGNLNGGIYIISATDRNGNRNSLKVNVR